MDKISDNWLRRTAVVIVCKYGARQVFRKKNSACFSQIYYLYKLEQIHTKSPPALSRRIMNLNLSFPDFPLQFFVLEEIYVGAIISNIPLFLANFGFSM